MKASRRRVRCGVEETYCSHTSWTISTAEALALRVAGPEESIFEGGVGVLGVGDAGAAEAVEAACRLAGMV